MTADLSSALVPVEFYIFLALLVAGILGAMGWIMEREKRFRLLKATRELEKILALAADALKEHSEDKLAQVNSLIQKWDDTYCEEVGEKLPKLTWAPVSSFSSSRLP